MATLAPLQFMDQYRSLRVLAGVGESASHTACLPIFYQVQLGTYLMMNREAWTDPLGDYRLVIGVPASGKTKAQQDAAKQLKEWFSQYQENIRSAAMGKGAPQDYRLALEWAVRSGKIKNVTQGTLQQFCNEHLGIDCSGFVTNYLAATGKRTYSATLVRNTSAQSYYNVATAINNPLDVRQGDLLVWMDGRKPKGNPGHVAIVESYRPVSRVGGNMRVVEATGHSNAKPKLLDSWYSVETIIDKGDKQLKNDVMILQVKRHQTSHDRVAVIRPL